MTAFASTQLQAFRIPEGKTFEESRSVLIVDQLLLPHTIVWEEVKTIEEAYSAIKTMRVRLSFLSFTGLQIQPELN